MPAIRAICRLFVGSDTFLVQSGEFVPKLKNRLV
jgi:hypothetical protein